MSHPSPSALLSKINEAKDSLRSNSVYQDMCKEFEVDPDAIDLIPIRFGDIDVSAKTIRGIIILSKKLLNKGSFDKHIHYILHEILHNFQMTTRKKPTKGIGDGEYLDNKDEIEAFTYQVELLDNLFGEPKAEDYVDNLLDYHEVDEDDERDEKKDELMGRLND